MRDLGGHLRGRRADFDRQTERWVKAHRKEGGRIYCAEGCANCCSLAVHATAVEAVVVAGGLNAERSASLDRYVGRLRRSLPELTDLKSYLRLHRRAIGPCPFLGPDNACVVYEDRPFSCRSLLSTRDAAWCGIDPGDLHPLEKEAFRSSLDPEVVAYPTHYVAWSGELGHEAEADLLACMREEWGVSLSGNLPLLTWLSLERGLSETLSQGPEPVRDLLRASGFDHPFLLQLQPAP